MLRISVVFVLFQAAVVLSAPLQWPQTYQTSGQIILPYGDIAEPFTAIVDMTRGMSYLNTYESQLMLQYNPKLHAVNLSTKISCSFSWVILYA